MVPPDTKNAFLCILSLSPDCIVRLGFTPPWSHSRTDTREVVRWTSPEYDVDTRVHECGGGSFTVYNNTLFFSRGEDNSMYRQDGPSAQPVRLTHDSKKRYADGIYNPKVRIRPSFSSYMWKGGRGLEDRKFYYRSRGGCSGARRKCVLKTWPLVSCCFTAMLVVCAMSKSIGRLALVIASFKVVKSSIMLRGLLEIHLSAWMIYLIHVCTSCDFSAY